MQDAIVTEGEARDYVARNGDICEHESWRLWARALRSCEFCDGQAGYDEVYYCTRCKWRLCRACYTDLLCK